MEPRRHGPLPIVFRFLAERRWTTLAGYDFYVVALAAGYYYNLTFVQLGLVDLGTRLVGMSPGEVSAAMAVLALVAVAVAVPTGVAMDRRGWSADLRMKLRLLFAVVTVQLALTAIAPMIRTPGGFLAWVVVCSATLGAGIPATFGLMVDFIPVRDRGMVAGIVAGLAFATAAVYPLEWRIEEFSRVLAFAMAPGAVVLGVLSFRRTRLVEELGRQHLRFGTGRFCRPAPVRTASAAFWGPVALMFGVFFIDSLGFLRLIDTPLYIFTSWQSPQISTRLFIAGTHVAGAAMAGVLYASLGRRWLFLWVFGLGLPVGPGSPTYYSAG